MRDRRARTASVHGALHFLQYVFAALGLGLSAAVGCVVALSAARTMDSAPRPAPPELPAVAAIAEPAPALELPRAAEPDAEAVSEPAAQAAPEPELETQLLEGTLGSGDTLARALARHGVGAAVTDLIAREMRPEFDFRRARPGHRFQLLLGADGSVLEFVYRTSETEFYRLAPLPGGGAWEVRRDEANLVPRSSRIAGVVDSSLYEAVQALGERPQLASDFAEIFAWDVDFSRAVQPGDEFRVLYERLYRTDESGAHVYVRPGRILAARYDGAGGEHTAVYFEESEGRGGYYRPDGSSVEGSFLRSPLRFGRVSSRFSAARRHPILKITRPHHGIDYAAAEGTPVWAVADGVVIYRAWAGGFGNLIKVRHAKGYVSYYAHLSRFASQLKVGDAVHQKQVVGYVGKTGLATGPHVCFRVAKDGRYVNPARIHSPAGPPVSPEVQHLFHRQRDLLLARLDGGLMVASDEAL